MTDKYGPPFGVYAAQNGGSLAADAVIANANLDVFTALFNPPHGSSAAHPDFQKIPPATVAALVAEVAALKLVNTAQS